MGIRLGIGGLKIGQRSGTAAVPFDWSSYWATLISCIVHSTNLKDVVLTFTAANGTLLASDFSVAGTTVNSITIGATTITLTCADDVVVGSVVTFNKTSETTTVTVSLSRNSDIVEAGGYGALNNNFALSFTSDRSFFNRNNVTKIRISGLITAISLYINKVLTGNTSFYFDVWRKDGTTYDRVGHEDILALVGDGNGIRNITLPNPIDVIEGDFVAFSGQGTATDAFIVGSPALANGVYYAASAPTTPNYNWAGQTSMNYKISMKVKAQATMLVTIGDSIMAGHPAHYSFCEESIVSVIANQIPYQMKVLNSLYTYQNMGIGSQTSTTVKDRFTADVIDLKPKIVVINGAVNDISGGVITEATFLTNYTTMLDACVTAGIVPVVCEMIPWNNGSNANMQKADGWMVSLKALVATYPTAVWVELVPTLGQFRAGGDEGNLWDIAAAYNEDNVHLNLAGYTKMAEVINAAIVAKGYVLA